LTLDELYDKLKEDAKSKGSLYGQVWHEADIDGYHLYMADTSFGNGPIFSIVGNNRYVAYERPEGEWVMYTLPTVLNDLEWIMPIAERAEWKYRLEKLQKH